MPAVAELLLVARRLLADRYAGQEAVIAELAPNPEPADEPVPDDDAS